MRRGEIYYIYKDAVDSIGSEQEAGRPAIIVANDKCNAFSQVVEVVYLTTKPKSDLPTHVTIRSSKYESTALCEQIHSVYSERIGSYIGSCSKREMDLVDIALSISLGLTFDSRKEPVEVQPQIIQQPQVQDDKEYEIKLMKAETERDVYKKMYTDLLSKMLNPSC